VYPVSRRTRCSRFFCRRARPQPRAARRVPRRSPSPHWARAFLRVVRWGRALAAPRRSPLELPAPRKPSSNGYPTHVPRCSEVCHRCL
jgi:hypothetical protein